MNEIQDVLTSIKTQGDLYVPYHSDFLPWKVDCLTVTKQNEKKAFTCLSQVCSKAGKITLVLDLS